MAKNGNASIPHPSGTNITAFTFPNNSVSCNTVLQIKLKLFTIVYKVLPDLIAHVPSFTDNSPNTPMYSLHIAQPYNLLY